MTRIVVTNKHSTVQHIVPILHADGAADSVYIMPRRQLKLAVGDTAAPAAFANGDLHIAEVSDEVAPTEVLVTATEPAATPTAKTSKVN